jgi:hypothetical protein
MLYGLRLRLSFYLLQLGVWIIPDTHTRNLVRQGLASAGNKIEEELTDGDVP